MEWYKSFHVVFKLLFHVVFKLLLVSLVSKGFSIFLIIILCLPLLKKPKEGVYGSAFLEFEDALSDIFWTIMIFHKSGEATMRNEIVTNKLCKYGPYEGLISWHPQPVLGTPHNLSFDHNALKVKKNQFFKFKILFFKLYHKNLFPTKYLLKALNTYK